MKKPILFAVLSLIILTQGHAQNKSDTEIYLLVRSMESAWDSKNAELFSDNFAPNHDYIFWNGMYSPDITRDASKSGHSFLFTQKDQKKTKAKYTVDKIRYLTDSVALVHILGSIYKEDEPPLPYPTQIHTWVVVRANNEWKIQSLHSSDIEYDVFIHEQTCPTTPSTEEQKTTYAQEFYKSYYKSLNN